MNMTTHMDSPPTMVDVDNLLVESIRDNGCVLFVGPQASLASTGYLGPPGPATLVAELAAQLHHVPLVAGDLILPRISSIYEKTYGDEPLVAFLQQQLTDKRYRPTAIHHWIAALPITHVISTAYDTLLDDLLESRRDPRKQVLNASQLGRLHEPKLIKLFGAVVDEESLRVTDVQLQSVFESRGPGTLTSFLDSAVGGATLLFVGYYLDNEIFRKLFFELRWQQHEPGNGRSRAKSAAAPRTAFAVQPPNQPPISWGRQLHLNVIRADVEQFMAALVVRVAEAREEDPPELPRLPAPDVLPAEIHRARTEAMISVLNRWGGSVGQEDDPHPYMSTQVFHILRFIHQLQAEKTTTADAEAGDGFTNLEARVRLAYGSAEWAEGNHEEAKRFLKQAAELDSGLLEAHVSLHYLLTEMREYEPAMDSYKKILELDSQRTALPGDDYDILAVLGADNLGIVYKALDKHEQREVSATVLRRALQQNLDRLDRFEQSSREANGARIASLIHWGEHRGRFYIVQELVEAMNLARWREKHEPGANEVITLIDNVAAALEDVHRRGLPHLSLNPHNILCTDGSQVTLINFREMELLVGQLHPEGVRDQDYLAPEQRAGKPGDERSDVYALGTIAQWLLKPDLNDEAFEVFIDTARQIDPQRRYGNMIRMRQELRRVSNARPPEGSRWVFQPFYQLLSLLTGIWRLFERRENLYRRVGLLALLLILTIGLELAPLDRLRFATRFLLSLAMFSVTAGWITGWRTGGVARQYGYASLIRSGAGMGVLFGILTTFWHLRNLVIRTDAVQAARALAPLQNTFECSGAFVTPVSLGALKPFELLAFLLTATMLNLILILIILVTAHAVARSSEARWGHYLTGFYSVFFLWFFLILVSTIVLARPLQCIIVVQPST